MLRFKHSPPLKLHRGDSVGRIKSLLQPAHYILMH